MSRVGLARWAAARTCCAAGSTAEIVPLAKHRLPLLTLLRSKDAVDLVVEILSKLEHLLSGIRTRAPLAVLHLAQLRRKLLIRLRDLAALLLCQVQLTGDIRVEDRAPAPILQSELIEALQRLARENSLGRLVEVAVE